MEKNIKLSEMDKHIAKYFWLLPASKRKWLVRGIMLQLLMR